eukprot:364344-Chlamydomonas_euryale.AAC.21
MPRIVPAVQVEEEIRGRGEHKGLGKRRQHEGGAYELLTRTKIMANCARQVHTQGRVLVPERVPAFCGGGADVFCVL